MSRPTVVFVSLALNQARFYAGIARQLMQDGWDAEIISVHEGAAAWLRDQGVPATNFFEFVRQPATASLAELSAVAAEFGIENLGRTITHEKAAYQVRDSLYLARKLVSYLEAMKAILQAIEQRSKGRIEVVQELGGFLSVVAAFYAARWLRFGHTFMEPACFQGRIQFVRNSFAAPVVPNASSAAGREVSSYLEETVRSRRLIIPVKDKAHYRTAAAKVFNARNVRRLIEKGVQKYVSSQREEFDHLGLHVRMHLSMLRNARTLRRYYQPLPEAPFIYYPLHVPADVALTLRAPEYLDQLGLLDYLARTIPVTHFLVFKEHPALIGALSPRRVRELLRLNDRVVLLPPWLNNHDVMRRAELVVTVNSKSGAEAIMLKRPVLALGDSFYRTSDLVMRADSPAQIEAAIPLALRRSPPDDTQIGRFFQAVFDRSYPGEVFADTEDNFRVVAGSLTRWFGVGELRSQRAMVSGT